MNIVLVAMVHGMLFQFRRKSHRDTSIFRSFFSSYILSTLFKRSIFVIWKQILFPQGLQRWIWKRKLNGRRDYANTSFCQNLPRSVTRRIFTKETIALSRDRRHVHACTAHRRAVQTRSFPRPRTYDVHSFRSDKQLSAYVRAFRVRAHAIFARTPNGYGPAVSTGANPFASFDKLLTAEQSLHRAQLSRKMCNFAEKTGKSGDFAKRETGVNFRTDRVDISTRSKIFTIVVPIN